VPVDVHVVTPERQLWSGDAQTVIAHGVDGEVGILSGHAPLLIQLAIAPLRIQQEDGQEIVVVVDGGFLHVTSGEEGTRVDVMASDGQLASEVDIDAARRRADELQGLDTTVAEADVDVMKAEMQKAIARINLAG
jgi:F-type H+-transporting ATPase subunit epsilon